MRSLRFVGIRLQAAFAFVVAIALLLTAPGFAAARDLSIGSHLAEAVDDVEFGSPSLLVYHQITAFTDEEGGFMFPVLSGDGTRAAFSRFVVSEDPGVYGTTSIFALSADGTGLSEIDTYETLCSCDALVDISDDGQTVVSSDGVQLRVTGAGGARELLALSEISPIGAVRITGDGRTVYFVLYFDTSTRDSEQELARGVWAVNADGGNLRQVVGAEALAVAMDVPVEAASFYYDARWLDVSDDGSQIAFGGFAYDHFRDGMHFVFTAPGDGGNPRPLLGPVAWLYRLAISGDGATVAYDAVPRDAPSLDDNELGVVATAGGEPRAILTRIGSGWTDNRLQLSADGGRLLVPPAGLLLDTETGATWQLAVQTPGTHLDPRLLVSDTLDAATMSADATRFLYSMALADWIIPNPRQLATLDLEPLELGDAPFIAEPALDRAELPLDDETKATAFAAVEVEGELIGLGLVALRDGMEDDNTYAQLYDGGENGDAEAGDGIFSAEFYPYGGEAENPTGPRMLRIEAEIETADGLRHAMAVEFGPLVLTESA
jgi:hypothetical protein